MKYDTIVIGFGKCGKTIAPFLAKNGTRTNTTSLKPKMMNIPIKTPHIDLDPPKIIVNGLLGFLIAGSKLFSSFSIRKPIPFGKYEAIPTFDAWALCAVPKASFI